jgi:hypothetical protein
MSEMQPSALNLSRETSSSHEPMTEVQLAELISATGNHEGKALLMLTMGIQGEGHADYGQADTHRLIADLPGAINAKLGNKTSQFTWCDGSLIPAGLVAETQQQPRRMAATKEGLEVGVPLAALLLDFSDRYDVDLAQIFGGRASSAGVRSPQLRIKLLEELLSNPAGTTNLKSLVNISGAADQVVIEKHLRKLNDAGLLKYKDWDYGVNVPRYMLEEQHYKPIMELGAVTAACLEYFQAYGEATRDALIKYCLETIPGSDLKSIGPKIAQSVYGLKRVGAVSVLEGQSANQLLDVNFTIEQEAMWLELLNMLDEFRGQDDEVLAKYTQMGRDFLNDPEKVGRAIKRYTERSVRLTNNLSSLVMAAIKDKASTGTVRNIVQLASRKHGAALSHYGVLRIMNELVEQGQLKLVDGKVQHYEPVVAEPNITSKD